MRIILRNFHLLKLIYEDESEKGNFYPNVQVDDIFTTGVLTEKSKVKLYDITSAVEIFKENATKLDSKTMFHLTKQSNVGFPFVSN